VPFQSKALCPRFLKQVLRLVKPRSSVFLPTSSKHSQNPATRRAKLCVPYAHTESMVALNTSRWRTVLRPARAGKKNLAVFASFLRITLFESTKLPQNRVQKRTKTYRTHCFSGASLPLSPLDFPELPPSRTKTYQPLFGATGLLRAAGSGNVFRFFGPFLRITHLESAKPSQNRVQKRTKTYRQNRDRLPGPEEAVLP